MPAPEYSLAPERRLPGADGVGPLSFDEVFAREGAFVGRALHFLGVAGPDIEDAAQEVFVVVLRRLDSFSGGSSRAWVRQICVLVAQNYRRTRRRRREDAVDEVPEVATPALQHTTAEERQLQARLFSLLEKLTDAQREVFVLHEIEGLSMVEVCETLGCLRPTAYARLTMARSRLLALSKGKKGWLG